MLVPRTQIQIGKFLFTYCISVEVESSYDTLSDTCSIVVPGKATLNGRKIDYGETLFNRGDIVKVEGTFGNTFRELFTGFAATVKPKRTVEIECEDALWQLKQTSITASYKSVTLQQLLADHCSIPFDAVDVSLGQFRISKANMAEVLEELRNTYGLYSWIRSGKLYSGLAFRPELQKEVTFGIGYNVVDFSDLEYRRPEEIRLKIKAISMLPDNTKIEIELGDSEGEQRTLHYYNLSEKELKARAEQEMNELKGEGYRGSFKAFGEPGVNHGDICVLKDKFYSGRDGKYLVKKVTTTTGVDGFFQVIELDRKIN